MIVLFYRGFKTRWQVACLALVGVVFRGYAKLN